MKPRFLRTRTYFVLATILALVTLPFLVSGQVSKGGKSEAGKLEGTWKVEITAISCQTGVPVPGAPIIQAFNTFVRGGSLLETGNGSLFRSPGHGIWQHVGDSTYTATLSLFRFNSSGTFTGSVRSTKAIDLAQGHDEFTSSAMAEILDANGNLITTVCSTETARRFQ